MQMDFDILNSSRIKKSDIKIGFLILYCIFAFYMHIYYCILS
jgi:hypothetical protein